jgi:hypothetical protein
MDFQRGQNVEFQRRGKGDRWCSGTIKDIDERTGAVMVISGSRFYTIHEQSVIAKRQKKNN